MKIPVFTSESIFSIELRSGKLKRIFKENIVQLGNGENHPDNDTAVEFFKRYLALIPVHA